MLSMLVFVTFLTGAPEDVSAAMQVAPAAPPVPRAAPAPGAAPAPPSPAVPGVPAVPPVPGARLQDQPPPKPPAPPGAPLPPAAPQPPGPPQPPGRLVNVQVELTIRDQFGSGMPETKTVSLIVSDANMGRVRASAVARPSERTGTVPSVLNVDARPRVQANGLIHLELTLLYQPLRTVQSGEPSQTSPTELNQSLSVLLQDGKPLVVSQAADPVTDRRISVEAKATVLK
jgi:hypothetical protein